MTERKSILIVDDSADLLHLYQEFLKEEGLDVHIAVGGKEALALLETLTVDLLVVDCLMPYMNGVAFLRESIRRKPDFRKTIRIIALSGLNSDAAEISEMKPLVDRIIEKTNDLSSMLEIILHEASLGHPV
jgi:CheY-like chemotaxis protein